MQKIYIMESIPKLRDYLVNALSLENHLMTCLDVEQALEDIKSFQPDLVVMDMTMRDLDAIGLLTLLFAADIRPKLVLSFNYAEDAVQKILSRFRVSFLLSRPVRQQVLLNRIADVLLELEGGEGLDKRRIANDLMLKLGLQLELQGYRCTLEGIIYASNNINCMLTTELYPDLAKRFGGNGKQVEHIIRTCITNAWKNRDEKIWNLYFPKNRYGSLKKVTNGAFLKRMAFAVNDLYNFATMDDKKANNGL